MITDQLGISRDMLRIWVKALRSGEYALCAGRLIHDGAYCALGILANELGFEKRTYAGYQGTPGETFFIDPATGRRLNSALPESIMPKDLQKTFIFLNDHGVEQLGPRLDEQTLLNNMATAIEGFFQLQETQDAS